MVSFSTNPSLARALAERDYTDPTEVQAAVLEAAEAGRDMLVSAQTGSGKTVAYGLALAPTLLGDAEVLPPAAEPLALIVAPTRELALQVHRELSWLYQYAGGRVVSCVGGMDPRAEQRLLAKGAHIVVGTPGRLRDHLERGGLNVSRLRAVVLDEADEMLDLGFREDLEFILEATPHGRRTLLFSATLPPGIVGLAKRYQRDALRIAVAAGRRGHADIEYRAIRIAPNEVEHAVVNVLRFIESPTALVFCNTRDSVRHLHAILSERGFSAVSLSGEMGQNERNHALQALRDGRARVCVATDVAARGIDLPNLGLVIHAELPQNSETLQHRSGRTGRAGRKGVSALLVTLPRKRRAEQLLAGAGVQATWSGPPSADDIAKLDQERLLQSPILTAETTEDDLAMARSLLEHRRPEELAAALVRLYRSQLPAAEEVFDPGPGTQREERPQRGERYGGGDESRERGPRKSGLPGASLWFRLNVGRATNADPRWLLPLICRQGNVTKQDIGVIRISERETQFEIAAEVADRFAAAVRQNKSAGPRIDALGDPVAPREARPPRLHAAATEEPRRPAGPYKKPFPKHRKGPK